MTQTSVLEKTVTKAVELRPVDLLHADWPAIEAAIIRVKKKTAEPWSVGYVIEKILEQRAGLFQFFRDGEPFGYLIVERMDQGDWVWLNAWMIEGAGIVEMAPECIAEIDRLAKCAGAKEWRCGGRPGWKAVGLEPIATVYRRSIA